MFMCHTGTLLALYSFFSLTALGALLKPNLSPLHSVESVTSFTMATTVPIFRTHCLEFGFLWLVLRIVQEKRERQKLLMRWSAS